MQVWGGDEDSISENTTARNSVSKYVLFLCQGPLIQLYSADQHTVVVPEGHMSVTLD